jgi:hypothetical protein
MISVSMLLDIAKQVWLLLKGTHSKEQAFSCFSMKGDAVWSSNNA